MFEQRENENGYFVYYNKINGKTQFEDPKLQEILSEIKTKYKAIKYITYRSAEKLFSLKKVLQTISLPFSMVTSVLDHHRLNITDTSPLIKPFQLTAVIFDVFYASEKLGYFLEQTTDFDLQSACSVLANFFWNIFDVNRTTPISLLELRQTFLLLCDTPSFDEIVFEHFLLGADHNRCISKLRFESMIKVLSKIMTYLGEGNNFSQTQIQKIVQESFIECPGIVGLNEYQFNNLWKNTTVNNNNSFTLYSTVLALTQRIKESEFVIHNNASCISCKKTPIQGLKFKCQRCKTLSLCLECFSIGYTDQKHDITHRMFEISTNDKKPSKFSSILSKICNWFSRSSTSSSTTTRSQIKRCNTMNMETKLIDSSEIEIATEANELKSESILSKISDGKITILDNSSNISVIDRLMEVIDLLTEENDVLQKKLKDKNPEEDLPTFLENHSKILSEQIKQLKIIWERSNSYLIPPHSSTPYRNNNNSSKRKQRSIDICSPLSRSIHGIEINKTYLEQNKSDLSVRDISSWLQMRQRSINTSLREKNIISRNSLNIDTEMINFKCLLHKVKEIVDDSYSDNIELSRATHQLEKVLDDIIGEEERKRN